jgi:hypothetical protein
MSGGSDWQTQSVIMKQMRSTYDLVQTAASTSADKKLSLYISNINSIKNFLSSWCAYCETVIS